MSQLSPLKEVSLEIRRARKALDITQKKLAAVSGISQAAIARIEKKPEEYNPGYSTIFRLVDALDAELLKKQPMDIGNKEVGEIMHREIVSIRKDETLHKALELMKDRNFSQLPVLDNTGNVMGTIYQRQIAGILLEGKNPKQIKAGDIMEPSLPQIDKSTKLARVKSILEQFPAIIITENMKVVGIVTSYDWFKVA